MLHARTGIVQTLTAGVIVGGFGRVLSTGREPWDFPRMCRFTPPSERSRWTEAWASGADLFGHPDKDVLGQLMANAARVVRRGGNIGMGMHGNVPGMGIHYEMWLHALGGMPNYEILRSATIVGATAIGHARDFGSLEPGKLADLQVLDENPLEDIAHTNTVRCVMKNGRMYQASDLTQIWPDRRPLSPVYVFREPQRAAAGAAASAH
jgi:hypothetical protein